MYYFSQILNFLWNPKKCIKIPNTPNLHCIFFHGTLWLIEITFCVVCSDNYFFLVFPVFDFYKCSPEKSWNFLLPVVYNACKSSFYFFTFTSARTLMKTLGVVIRVGHEVSSVFVNDKSCFEKILLCQYKNHLHLKSNLGCALYCSGYFYTFKLSLVINFTLWI